MYIRWVQSINQTFKPGPVPVSPLAVRIITPSGIPPPGTLQQAPLYLRELWTHPTHILYRAPMIIALAGALAYGNVILDPSNLAMVAVKAK